jgi:hypothetical protein
MATSLEGLPDTIVELSVNLSNTDDNLGFITGNLTSISQRAALISSNLGEYEKIVTHSKSSMENVKSMLTNIQTNLVFNLTAAAVVMTLLRL